MTAGFYALAQPFSYAWPNTPGGRDLRIPVAGPWIAVAHNGCSASSPNCSRSTLWMRGILTVLDGLGQAGGLLVALEGALLTTSDSPRMPSAQPPHRSPSTGDTPQMDNPESQPPVQNLFLAPIPMGVSDSGIGIGVSGVF